MSAPQRSARLTHRQSRRQRQRQQPRAGQLHLRLRPTPRLLLSSLNSWAYCCRCRHVAPAGACRRARRRAAGRRGRSPAQNADRSLFWFPERFRVGFSRACLGKSIVFSVKMAQKRREHSPAAAAEGTPASTITFKVITTSMQCFQEFKAQMFRQLNKQTNAHGVPGPVPWRRRRCGRRRPRSSRAHPAARRPVRAGGKVHMLKNNHLRGRYVLIYVKQ